MTISKPLAASIGSNNHRKVLCSSRMCARKSARVYPSAGAHAAREMTRHLCRCPLTRVTTAHSMEAHR
jgi:hypothetical protein